MFRFLLYIAMIILIDGLNYFLLVKVFKNKQMLAKTNKEIMIDSIRFYIICIIIYFVILK